MSSPQSMAEFQARADETLAEFRRGVAEIKQRSDRARSAIADATAVATGGNGVVTANVTVEGQLRELTLRPDFNQLDASTLSTAILRTIRDGAAQALGKARVGVTEALGADNRAIEILDRRIREFSAPDAPASSPPAMPSTEAESDGWDGRG